MDNIKVLKADITTANVDVIVNAANPMMLGGGGVDGAIHKAAGSALLEECRKVKAVNGIRCPFGEARITAAGNLTAKFVIHAVGPRYHQEKEPALLLRSAYRASLELAVKHKCNSIAFPAISCGAYGYPLNEAADIAINTCSESEFIGMEVHFYLFSTELYDLWMEKLDRT